MFFPLSLQYACRKASIRNVREKFPSRPYRKYDTGGRKRKFAHMSNESGTVMTLHAPLKIFRLIYFYIFMVRQKVVTGALSHGFTACFLLFSFAISM